MASCQAITVSMSSNGAKVSDSFIMPSSSELKSSATLSEGTIYHEANIKGDAEVSQSTSSGGQTFQASVTAPDIKTTQIVTEGGVSGSVSYDGIPLMTSQDEEMLAENPDIAMTVEHLSVSGKPVIISGGKYPIGGVDLTEPYYIDPAQTFKFTTYSGASQPSASDESFGWFQNWQTVRNSITKDQVAWNAATGKQVFDGTILVDGYRTGNDGINAIYPTGSFAIGQNLAQTRTIYNTATRKVVDVDIGINLEYTPNLFQSQAIMDTVLLHEMGHAMGMKHNPYSSTTVMRPTFDYTQAGLSGDDTALARAKYNS